MILTTAVYIINSDRSFLFSIFYILHFTFYISHKIIRNILYSNHRKNRIGKIADFLFLSYHKIKVICHIDSENIEWMKHVRGENTSIK